MEAGKEMLKVVAKEAAMEAEVVVEMAAGRAEVELTVALVAVAAMGRLARHAE